MDLSLVTFFGQALQFNILIENIYESITGLSKYYKLQIILLKYSAILRDGFYFFLV